MHEKSNLFQYFMTFLQKLQKAHNLLIILRNSLNFLQLTFKHYSIPFRFLITHSTVNNAITAIKLNQRGNIRTSFR